MDVPATLEIITVSSSLQEQEDKRKELAAYLNQLLVNDFAALVQLLYRVDVSEQKLKTVLKENPEADAGDLIAELMIERQKQKAASRQSLSSNDEDPLEEEAW